LERLKKIKSQLFKEETRVPTLSRQLLTGARLERWRTGDNFVSRPDLCATSGFRGYEPHKNILCLLRVNIKLRCNIVSI
jgi:hypothetical protein